MLEDLEARRQPIITQNGEAKAVLQDVASYEETQETLALLKILALGNVDAVAGHDVVLSCDAGRDLEDIYDHIVEFDSKLSADHVSPNIGKSFSNPTG